MRTLIHRHVLVFSTLIGWACALTASANEPATPSYSYDVLPILSKNCFACHGPDDGHRQADLRLDDGAAAIEQGAIAPGKPAESELIRRITSDDPEERMPPAETGHTLSVQEIDTLTRWVAAGAKYSRHWSYEPPQRPPLPEVSRPTWCRNPIDRFVLAQLDRAGLQPEPETDRYRLIRRLSLDLTGLPPTIEEVNAFAFDNRPDAYEQLVDRLLASPAYGEHWARKWLDLARFADTHGYEKDDRRTVWPFRDWVIQALNADLPFDQFTIEQLAGDLLPNATQQQFIATAFHRNTMQNDEGGTDDEEFRVAAVIDRVNTTLQVWMGTTIGCCQCHSHKYDPFSQREYYELFAFFNQSADADRVDQEPTIALGEGKQAVKMPIMKDLPAEQQRTTRMLIRGSFLSPGDTVSVGTPQVFPSFSADQPRTRLGLAQWLVSRDNPLTARVAVNRQWEQLFGAGIVLTSEDFGSQGTLPTHPELLDWLAIEFMENGWSLKKLTKTIVTSAAYRQSSRTSPEKLARDPDNRLISRGPRYRLSAEQIRDQTLAVSGLLSRKLGGPSVMPPQPDGVWQVVYSSDRWAASEGEDRYRRGLYTFWRRTSPYPSAMALDATSRETCTIRRIGTNTPIAAFTLLNDPAYVEAAQALARSILHQDGDTAARTTYAFRRVLARQPTLTEVERLTALFESERQYYRQDTEAAAKMANRESAADADASATADLAAWTVVSNVLLNLDETLNK